MNDLSIYDLATLKIMLRDQHKVVADLYMEWRDKNKKPDGLKLMTAAAYAAKIQEEIERREKT